MRSGSARPDLVTPVHLRWRCRGFDSRKGFDDPVAVLRICRHEPGIARGQMDGLTFKVEFGPSGNDVTDRLVVAAAGGFVRLRRFVPPQSHGQMFSRHEIGLSHRALRRGLFRNFLDRAVVHVSAPWFPGWSINRRAAGSRSLWPTEAERRSVAGVFFGLGAL